MTLKAGLANKEDSAEAKPKPAPETQRRLGRTQEHNTRRRLCGDSAKPKHTSKGIDSAKNQTHAKPLEFLIFLDERHRKGAPGSSLILIRQLPRRRLLRLVRFLHWLTWAGCR